MSLMAIFLSPTSFAQHQIFDSSDGRLQQRLRWCHTDMTAAKAGQWKTTPPFHQVNNRFIILSSERDEDSEGVPSKGGKQKPQFL